MVSNGARNISNTDEIKESPYSMSAVTSETGGSLVSTYFI